MEEANSKRYKGWEEVVVSNDKGKREVHYYLKDGLCCADLAVVGKERSLRHMCYETVDGFMRPGHVAAASPSPHCSPRANGSVTGFKWKTRREVIDWLSSVVSGHHSIYRSSSPIITDNNYSDYEEGPSSKAVSSSKETLNSKEFTWLGPSWTCKKKRKHYRSFCRRGITISVHDFVLIMGEDSKRLVAYVDDLYSDSKTGTNMVSVQWFHTLDEISHLNISDDTNPREIFFSSCFQDLIIECIDGLTSVLSQPHFDRFSTESKSIAREKSQPGPFICRKQIDSNEVVKDFDVTGLTGYWTQETMRSMFSPTPLRLRVKISTGKKGRKDVTARWQLLPGQHVEVLSQDSGINGCWFRCLILRKYLDRIKVRYFDVPNADGHTSLEEWVWCNREAKKDEVAIRMEGRSTVRPFNLDGPGPRGPEWNYQVGSVVDARWLDGWWEGIIIRSDSNSKFHVYFPAEKRVSIFAPEELRPSSEWVGDKWQPLSNRKDIVASILSSQDEAVLAKPNLTESKASSIKVEIKEKGLKRDLSESLIGLKWSSRKRRRFSPNNSKRSPGSSSGCSLEEAEPEAGFGIMDSLPGIDHENSNVCKIGGDSTLFNAPISISNLVMSQ